MLTLNQGNDVIINPCMFNLILGKEKNDDCVKIGNLFVSPVDHQETLVETYLERKVCRTGATPTENYIIRLKDVPGVLNLQGFYFSYSTH